MASTENSTIQINERTYDEMVDGIERSNNRTEQNQKKIKVKYPKCSMSYLNEYMDIITNLAAVIEEYYNLVSDDIKNLREVKETLKAADRF